LSETGSKVYISLHAKYTFFLSDFDATSVSYRFSKYTKIQNLMKILPMEVELL